MRRVTATCDAKASTANVEPAGDGLWHGMSGQLSVSNGAEPNSCDLRVCGNVQLQSGDTSLQAELGMTERQLRSIATFNCDRYRLRVAVCPVTRRAFIEVQCDAERYAYTLIHGRLSDTEDK